MLEAQKASILARLVLLGGLGMLTSCGSGDGFVTDDSGQLQPTFGSIQANIFTPVCVQCHAGAGAPFGLRLDPANSFALLVGVASGQEPSLLRVAPNDPDNSYLIQKLEGTASSGEQMPAGLPPLPQADIDVIRQWISDGAMPDAPAMPPSSPVRVSSMSPLPGSVEPMLPTSIMAIFDREIDATSLNTTTFLVDRSGGDGSFNDGNEVGITPVSATVPAANPSSAVLDLTGVVSVEDTYRVRLIGTGPATILDLDSNALDGEFSGTFPSGDGLQGGNFEAQFEVVGIQPTLQSIQDNLFTPTCSGCHTGPSGGNLPAGLDLTSVAMSFADLVNVASSQVPALDRVTPNDPDNSYLIQKLEGTAAVGGRMPAFSPPLDQATIEVIRDWISNGAPM